jgi:hypothetical protein
MQSRSSCLINKPHGNNFEQEFQTREQGQNHLVLSLLSENDHTISKQTSRFQQTYGHGMSYLIN